MNLERALNITGWMSEVELECLANICHDKQHIIEIGSWKGRSTRALLDNSRAIVWAVDHWSGPQVEDEHESHIEFTPCATELGRVGLFLEFMSHVEDHAHRLHVMRMTSQEAFPILMDFYGPVFDMIFIDGSHDRAAVTQDITLYENLLAPGGLLCGHDYWPKGHPGVREAVQENLPDFQVYPSTSIWYVTRPAHA